MNDRQLKLLRDLASLALGVAGIIHQFFIVPHPDTVVLGAATLFLLGPAALRLDGRSQGSKDTHTHSDSSPE